MGVNCLWCRDEKLKNMYTYCLRRGVLLKICGIHISRELCKATSALGLQMTSEWAPLQRLLEFALNSTVSSVRCNPGLLTPIVTDTAVFFNTGGASQTYTAIFFNTGGASQTYTAVFFNTDQYRPILPSSSTQTNADLYCRLLQHRPMQTYTAVFFNTDQCRPILPSSSTQTNADLYCRLLQHRPMQTYTAVFFNTDQCRPILPSSSTQTNADLYCRLLQHRPMQTYTAVFFNTDQCRPILPSSSTQTNADLYCRLLQHRPIQTYTAVLPHALDSIQFNVLPSTFTQTIHRPITAVWGAQSSSTQTNADSILPLLQVQCNCMSTETI